MAAAKTSSSLEPNVASALCYVPFISGLVSLIFLIIEKNPTVKWHAAQSLALAVSVFVLSIVLFFISWLLFVAYLVLSIYMAYVTYQGRMVKLPVFSKVADALTKK